MRQIIMADVFLPTRLHIVNPCITATGIIKSIHVENDGDFHIKLLADNNSLINQANIKFENGDLVLEAICQNPVSRSEVGSACDNFNHPALSIPPVGSHVAVTGSYVLDTRNNNWAEIHPITSIQRYHKSKMLDKLRHITFFRASYSFWCLSSREDDR